MLGLKRGSQGPEVRKLRIHLTLHHGARLRASDVMDPLAVGALKRFQALHRLPVTGEVCGRTEAALHAEELAYETAARGAGAVLPLAPRGR